MVQPLKGDGKAIFTLFIGVILAIAMLVSAAQLVVSTTNTLTTSNYTVTSPTVDATVDLPGRELMGSVVCANGSAGGSGNCAGNYTFTTEYSNGLKTVQMNTTIAGDAAGYSGLLVNLTYSYKPDGYLNESSSRSIMSLILIFGALAIMIFSFVVFLKDGSLGTLLGRRK